MWTVQNLVSNNTVPMSPLSPNYAPDNSAEHCNSAAKKPFTSKKLASCGRQPGGHSVLTSCLVVSRTHFVPVILLRWVSNSSNTQAHDAALRTLLVDPVAICKFVIANGILPRSKVRRGWKSVICWPRHSALKCTKECNPSNAVEYCGGMFSIFLIVCELERWKKKN